MLPLLNYEVTLNDIYLLLVSLMGVMFGVEHNFRNLSIINYCKPLTNVSHEIVVEAEPTSHMAQIKSIKVTPATEAANHGPVHATQ